MNDPQLDTLQILLIIIVPSFIAGLPALVSAFAAWKDKRKRTAEALTDEGTAAEKVSNAWEKLAEDLQKRIDKQEDRLNRAEQDTAVREQARITQIKDLEKEIKLQGNKINLLEKGVHLLIEQIERLGAIPVWKFPED